MSVDTHEAIYSAMLARYTGDTGSGGLANTTGDQYVRRMYRDGDKALREHKPWPHIIVRITDRDDARMGAGYETEAQVELHVFCERDKGFAQQNAVNDRIRTKYNNFAVPTTSSVAFSWMVHTAGFQAEGARNELHYVHQFSLRTQPTVLGAQASFTWATAPLIGGGTIACVLSEIGPDVDLKPVTRFADTAPRWQGAMPGGTARVSAMIDSTVTAAPAIPRGTTGTLTVTLFGSETWTCAAVVERVLWRAQSNQGSPPQVLGYDFRLGDGTSTITAST